MLNTVPHAYHCAYWPDHAALSAEALETDTNAWAGRGRGGPIADSPDTTRPRDSEDRECRDHSRLLRSQSTL